MSKCDLRRILFVCLLLQLNFILKAQLREKYVTGSIEFQDNTKKDGLIKEDEIGVMEYRVYFKLSDNQKEATVYDTSSIKKVNLSSGEVYNLLHFKPYYEADSVAVLAHLLVEGRASLYEIFYKSDKLFIVLKDGVTYALQEDKLEIGETQLTEYHFKEFLNNALDNSAALKSEIDYVAFNEKEIADIISAYNKSVASPNRIMTTSKNKAVHFIIADFGGMIADANTSEVYFQGIYRTYLPQISKSTSFNVGISYYQYKYRELVGYSYYNTYEKYTETLWSIPFQFQQNILNKNIRPYVFAGVNLSYLKLVNAEGVTQLDKGFQNNYGVGFLYGLGIEGEVYKNFRLKAEYRNENFSHLITVGVGYVFLRH